MRNFDVTDILRLETLTHGDLHAALDALVYLRRTPEENGRPVLIWHICSLADGREQTFRLPDGARDPRLSPDGTELAYAEDRNICTVNITNGGQRMVCELPAPPYDLVWSPDSRTLLFSMRTPAQKAAEKAADHQLEETGIFPDNAVAFEDFGFKFDGAGYTTQREAHLWLADLQTGETRQLTFGPFDDFFPVWTPAADAIVFISGRAHDRSRMLAADLYTVSAAGGEPVRISTIGTIVTYPIPFRPLVTPDGLSVVAAYLPEDEKDPNFEKGLPLSRLVKAALDGSGDQDIFGDEPEAHECVAFPYNTEGARCVFNAQLSSDGRFVYFRAGRDGATLLYRANLTGTPSVRLLTPEGETYLGMGTPYQGRMVVSFADAAAPADFWLMDESSGRRIRRLSQSNTFMQDVSVSEPESFRFDTLDGCGSVQGWVIAPPINGGSHPAILYIHGGPHPYYTPCFDLELQCLAAAGWYVLYCNPRGSSGYGAGHLDARQAFDERAFTDLLQFVDEAVKRYPLIDAARLGVTGGSYGGYMTNKLATKSDRFACFVTQRSVTNELISYANSDMHGRSLDYESFLDFMKARLEASAVTFADRVRGPLLIQHGMDDLRCPVEGAHQFFIALKDTHKDLPVRLILYPQTAHGQPQAPDLLIRYRQDMLAWFAAHLGSKEGQSRT